jgi:hypothetical protein
LTFAVLDEDRKELLVQSRVQHPFVAVEAVNLLFELDRSELFTELMSVIAVKVRRVVLAEPPATHLKDLRLGHILDCDMTRGLLLLLAFIDAGRLGLFRLRSKPASDIIDVGYLLQLLPKRSLTVALRATKRTPVPKALIRDTTTSRVAPRFSLIKWT